jgi:hypothetical protein
VRHVYYPSTKSNGRILELLWAIKAKDGDRTKKLFQFLNVIGARALRIQLGRVLEMAESSSAKFTCENKIAERFGGQKELELIVPTPSVIPSDDDHDFLEAAPKLAWKPEDDKEAANEVGLTLFAWNEKRLSASLNQRSILWRGQQ